MRYRLNRSQRPQRRTEGVWRRSAAHACADSESIRPIVYFQYLQLVPMTAIFLAIAALILILGSVV
jgi:hypothetical protein